MAFATAPRTDPIPSYRDWIAGFGSGLCPHAETALRRAARPDRAAAELAPAPGGLLARILRDLARH